MFDSVVLEEGVEVPEVDGIPKRGWQTKSFERELRTYKITDGGVLLEEQFHYEEVPREERENPTKMMRRVHDGWKEKQFHGIMHFYQRLPQWSPGDDTKDVKDSEFYTFRAKFTDGELVSIKRDEEWLEY